MTEIYDGNNHKLKLDETFTSSDPLASPPPLRAVGPLVHLHTTILPDGTSEPQAELHGQVSPSRFCCQTSATSAGSRGMAVGPISTGTAQRHQGSSVTAEDVKCVLHALAVGVEVTRHPLYLARTPLVSEIKTQRYVLALSAFGKL